MDLDAAAAFAPHAPASGSGPEVPAHLARRTGAPLRPQVDLKAGLGKPPLVGDRRYLGDEHAISSGELLPRRPVAVGTIADRLRHGAASQGFGRLYHRQRLLVVRG